MVLPHQICTQVDENQYYLCIGGFRGGAKGAAALLFSCIFKMFYDGFENRFIKCSLLLSPETLTLLYLASRIRPSQDMIQLD